MDRIELHDVEYGDCTVLVGRDQSILMVDCGSVSQYVRQGETDIHARFETIFHRYSAAASRQFLLTHYHRDHTSGFFTKLQADPNYFDRVYIPVIPGTAAHHPMPELALYARHFAAPQSDFAQVNTACLTIFERLQDTVGAERIITLCAGDAFFFDNTPYAVLSPNATDFSYPAVLTDAVSALDNALKPFSAATEFLRLKADYIAAYAACQAVFSPTSGVSAVKKERHLARLSDIWRELDALRGTLEHLPAAETIREILSDTSLRTAYTETQNDLSIVFHNIRTRTEHLDILMPGDASAKVLEHLAPKLYDSYYAVKAPHHGTESHYPAIFQTMAVSHFLISNGEYHAGGDISVIFNIHFPSFIMR